MNNETFILWKMFLFSLAALILFVFGLSNVIFSVVTGIDLIYYWYNPVIIIVSFILFELALHFEKELKELNKNGS